MRILFLLVLFLPSFYAFSQAPEIEWQNTIAGHGNDKLYSIVQTSDGGYIMGGISGSDIGIDKSEDAFGIGLYDGDGYFFNFPDYWVVKVDSIGVIEWENTLGGDYYDYLTTVCQASDGGFLIGGYSLSDSSGDKTENNLSPTLGYDFWVLKLNSTGVIEWENTIGGDGTEYLQTIRATPDGGFILGGLSDSGISEDKTEVGVGGGDYWVVKIDSAGIIEWQETIGGMGYDYMNDLQLTMDGGLILGGYSGSNISGDKTEININFSYDYWVVKLDAAGNIEWENTIGGNASDYLQSIQQTTDGGFILGGYSNSGISADKTDPNFFGGLYGYDYWVVKLNSLGNIEWQNTIGGTNDDFLYSIQQTTDAGFILGGSSFSKISGDKTEAGVGELGPSLKLDYWVIKLNTTGSIVWQNTIGGNHFDYLHSIRQTSDEGYILGGYSDSDLYGDKTEPMYGDPDASLLWDYWIIKLETDCYAIDEICNALDDNCNGIIDDGVTETISISAAGPTTFCQGNSVILNATTSGPNYQWKKNGVNIPGAILSSYTVTTKGTYTCETSSACDTELSTGIFVNVQKNPPASIIAGGATTFCVGGSVILTANAGGGLSYKWYKDAVLIPGATSINYTATTAGFYKCNVTKTATGCNKNSNGIMVTVPCKEGEELSSNSNFTIFPNPNTGTFNLAFNSPTGAPSPFEGGPRGMTIQIFNSLGQQIYSQQINSADGNINQTISINNLSKGIYFVRLINNDIYFEQKLIIQ